MAPHFRPKPSFKGKNINQNYGKGHQSAVNKQKKKWTPGNKFFDGSLQEGQGFAFKRKQKVQSQYNKLLRKQKWRSHDSKSQLTENYPEHLKHLYKAELEKLNEEEQIKRNRRKKGRAADSEEDEGEDVAPDSVISSPVTGTTTSLEEPTPTVTSSELPQSSQIESSPLNQRKQKMSSYQKTKQEYEKKKEERERKREAYLKDKAEREEALKKYKEKKIATYQLLKKKTKKGQPNLNLQMELLLQKIQAQKK